VAGSAAADAPIAEILILFSAVQISLDHDRCTGHGRCYSLAPELFDCDDEGYGQVLVADVPADLEERARVAINACPERAIRAS